jgi:HEAT repeat protein
LEAIRAELLHCLQDHDWELASEAAARLASLPRDLRTERALTDLLYRTEPGLAMTACTTLIRMGRPEAVAAAVELLQASPRGPGDPASRDARRSLTHALTQVEDDRHIQHMVTLVKAPDADVRRAAARALGSMPSSDAVKALGEALWDPEIEVRYGAILSLGVITRIHGHANTWAKYREDEDTYLGFWRKWYEEVGKPGVEAPEDAQGE